MTSKLLPVVEAYERSWRERSQLWEGGRRASKSGPPAIHCLFSVPWHLVKVGKGVWQKGCPVGIAQGGGGVVNDSGVLP
jgi:hypothetical protein